MQINKSLTKNREAFSKKASAASQTKKKEANTLLIKKFPEGS